MKCTTVTKTTVERQDRHSGRAGVMGKLLCPRPGRSAGVVELHLITFSIYGRSVIAAVMQI